LSYNNLTDLDNDFHFPKLKYLNLSSNQFTFIPEVLLNMVTLEELDFSYNKIEEIPDGLANLGNLKKLDIISNRLTKIPGFVFEMPSLGTINLNCNWIQAANIDNEYLPLISNKPIVGYFDQYLPDNILPGLYLGCARCVDNEESLEELKKLGIKTVISIGKEIVDNLDQFPETLKNDFNHYCYSIFDAPHEDLNAIYNEINEHINKGIKKGGCFVHCVAGISRSGAIMTAYLMINQKKRFQ